MRIISGKYKGKHFDVPSGFKARPTTDFAKESLFNILINYMEFEGCEALDLFTGTGSISLEMLSRGCKSVISVEKDHKHFTFLRKLTQELNDKSWMAIESDVFKFIERNSKKYDLIFADPPYALPQLSTIPDEIIKQNLLKENGIFVLEHGRDYDFSNHQAFFLHKTYGSVHFSFFSSEQQKQSSLDSLTQKTED